MFSHYEDKILLIHYFKFALTAFYETELLSEELTVSSLSLPLPTLEFNGIILVCLCVLLYFSREYTCLVSLIVLGHVLETTHCYQ